MHDTGDWRVMSEGTARVFGYTPTNIGQPHTLYDLQFDQALDAEDLLGQIKGMRDLQVVAIWGVPCDWCDQPANGYYRIPGCDCQLSCKAWVCSEHVDLSC